MNNKHSHAEAFMLMAYEDDLGNVEILWNSRDGVTPFVIRSLEGREMTHSHWERDIYAPDHEPLPGDRIFIELTKERLLEIEKKRIDRYWDDGDYPMKELPELGSRGKEGAAEHLVESRWEEGMPDIKIVEI